MKTNTNYINRIKKFTNEFYSRRLSVMNYKLIMLSVLVICSCSSNIKESNNTTKNHDARSVQDLYQSSDESLNSTFKELVNVSPALLKTNLKKDQQAWLKKRGEVCNYNGLEHPTDSKTLDCFTKQNKQQVVFLKQKKMILQDLLDNQFIGLSKSNKNDYTLDFQANCLCGNSMPYIDSQSERLITYSSCLSSNNKPLITEKITNIEFDEFGKLNVEALNNHGSTYQISFDPKGYHIYSIILFGKWGVIKEKTKSMVAAVGIGSIYSSKINNVCGNFDG